MIYPLLGLSEDEIAALAASSGGSLAAVTARVVMRGREVEAERQRRRDCEAEQWRVYADAQHRRSIEAAHAPAPGAVSQVDLETTIIGIGREVRKLVDQKIGSLRIDVDRVETRNEGLRELVSDMAREMLGQLDAREGRGPLLADAGIWSSEKLYQPGDVCTFDGSAWVAKEVHKNAKPGGSACWRLMIKKGRDGKDRR